MQVIINGEEYNFDSEVNIPGLLKELRVESGKVAVERNKEIVPKSTYDNVFLEDGDEIEIVHFIGGG